MNRFLSICAIGALMHGEPSRSIAAPARQWDARLLETDGTDLMIRMTVAVDADGRWELYSRPGAAMRLIPWYQRVLGRLLHKLPPHAALIALTNGTSRQEGSRKAVHGTLESPFLGNRVLVGYIENDHLEAELRRGSDTGTVAGTLSADVSTSTRPLRDYTAIAMRVRDTVSALVFDPSMPERESSRAFFREFEEASHDAQDDLDIVSAFVALRNKLGSSHFNFIRNPKIAAQPLDSIVAGDPSVNPRSLVRLQFPAPRLAYLYVSKWDRVGPVIDRAFTIIDSAKATALIIDIRGNPGGDATSMVPLTHLLNDTTPAGVFVGRRWYEAHQGAPTPGDYATFPVMSDAGEARELLTYVKTRGGVVGRIVPHAPLFTGAVFLLVDKASASASEPLAYALQSSRRGKVIGEHTAGAMLTALPHAVGEGFIVTVPEADYYAADGTRLELRGVEPDIRTTSADALVTVGQEVQKALPYEGAVWLANVYTTLRRYDDAERALREALSLAPTDAARQVIQERMVKLRERNTPR